MGKNASTPLFKKNKMPANMHTKIPATKNSIVMVAALFLSLLDNLDISKNASHAKKPKTSEDAKIII